MKDDSFKVSFPDKALIEEINTRPNLLEFINVHLRFIKK